MTKQEFESFLNQLFQTAQMTPKIQTYVNWGRTTTSNYTRLQLAGKIVGKVM